MSNENEEPSEERCVVSLKHYDDGTPYWSHSRCGREPDSCDRQPASPAEGEREFNLNGLDRIESAHQPVDDRYLAELEECAEAIARPTKTDRAELIDRVRAGETVLDGETVSVIMTMVDSYRDAAEAIRTRSATLEAQLAAARAENERLKAACRTHQENFDGVWKQLGYAEENAKVARGNLEAQLSALTAEVERMRRLLADIGVLQEKWQRRIKGEEGRNARSRQMMQLCLKELTEATGHEPRRCESCGGVATGNRYERVGGGHYRNVWRCEGCSALAASAGGQGKGGEG